MLRRRSRLLVTLSALLACTAPADAGAVPSTSASNNWAGYAVRGPGVRFRSVAGTWVQPAARCTAGERRYSAYWVGLGGVRSSSRGLEQIGTQVDCSSLGEAVYSAWYELLPARPVTVHIGVHPGDLISARVTVSRRTVRFYLADRTNGRVFTKRVRHKRLDRSSAEWIVEAPSGCNRMGCRTLPLADFGSVPFAGARATSTAGRTDRITSTAWSSTAITMLAGGDGPEQAGLPIGGDTAGATPSPLAPTGDAFAVTYQAPSGGAPPAPPPPTPSP